MQKMKNIVIIGGDARYLPLIQTLNKKSDIHIQILGFDLVEQSYTGVMQSSIDNLDTSNLDGVVLPITGIDDQGYIDTMFSNQRIQLTNKWFQSLPQNCFVFTGISNKTLDEYTSSRGLTLIRLMDRDDVAIYNSIPTAEGAIMLAIKHTDITIHHANVFILGFGRVGETTANAFAGLGANVSIVSINEADLARIYERSWQGYSFKQIGNVIEKCQILINTVPSQVVNRSLLEKMNNQAIIIDLASKPGGGRF
ncbi:dipicolinate synthase subunit A [Gracilibacillus boraciitolerans JCM 21714]|uniref:Dipicolinate synthase subunit A n=1 Tax=Gracilibacillus boraciitolerans JCM 21714 TaxID=1298598 RepID=W4VDT4_9BACI|nr:dipicolinate synthase subunit DpsA [Gracilibacillus boraciitolerans]GAE91565.1 dipicolinate synthase subunit A [Gracilibacillus boraciitolerans JCM 21714]